MKRFFFWVVVILVFGAGLIVGDIFGLPKPVRDAVFSLGGKVEEKILPADAGQGPVATENGDDSPSFSGEEKAASAPITESGALALCPRMDVSNAPRTNAAGVVLAADRVAVRGVSLRVDTAPGACLSSAYGDRDGKAHKGIDLHHPTGVDVIAGAAGTVLEAEYRDDYGNFVLIAHGGGVYTRYAHLRRFAAGITPGASVADGQRLGMMGRTAGYRVPVHLHYEILTGDYDTPAKAFGLDAVDPFSLAAA